MKSLFFLAWLAVPFASFAADGCRPIHDASPININVSAKNGGVSIITNDLQVKGNALSPTQPSEKLIFTAGAFAFTLTPIFSCKDGLLLEFQDAKTKKQTVIAWAKEAIVDGEAGSDYFINVVARTTAP